MKSTSADKAALPSFKASPKYIASFLSTSNLSKQIYIGSGSGFCFSTSSLPITTSKISVYPLYSKNEFIDSKSLLVTIANFLLVCFNRYNNRAASGYTFV